MEMIRTGGEQFYLIYDRHHWTALPAFPHHADAGDGVDRDETFVSRPEEQMTNDLDIPTLEILEESLLEFRGSLVLVTHDRYMLDRVSTIVLGLDGQGGAESFADYPQWEVWQAERKQQAKATARSNPRAAASPEATPAKTKLSYLEAREYGSIEQRVAQADDGNADHGCLAV